MAAEEDNVVDPDDLAEGFLEEGDDVDGDPDDLLVGDLDDEIDDGALEDEVPLPAEEDEEPVTALSKKKAKKAKKSVAAEEEEDDDDDDLLGEDDIESDLAKILDAAVKGRSEDDEEEAEEEEEDIQASNDPESGIQPKRPDERMCTQCFLLVRKGAPMCPIGDDACPLFPS